MDIKRGDIFYIYKGECIGSEQEGGRPGIVVSNDIGNKYAPVVSVVYLTKKPKNQQATHTVVDCNGTPSTVLCEQIYTISKSKIGDFIARCSEDEMHAVNNALLIALGL